MVMYDWSLHKILILILLVSKKKKIFYYFYDDNDLLYKDFYNLTASQYRIQ